VLSNTLYSTVKTAVLLTSITWLTNRKQLSAIKWNATKNSSRNINNIYTVDAEFLDKLNSFENHGKQVTVLMHMSTVTNDKSFKSWRHFLL